MSPIKIATSFVGIFVLSVLRSRQPNKKMPVDTEASARQLCGLIYWPNWLEEVFASAGGVDLLQCVSVIIWKRERNKKFAHQTMRLFVSIYS